MYIIFIIIIGLITFICGLYHELSVLLFTFIMNAIKFVKYRLDHTTQQIMIFFVTRVFKASIFTLRKLKQRFAMFTCHNLLNLRVWAESTICVFICFAVKPLKSINMTMPFTCTQRIHIEFITLHDTLYEITVEITVACFSSVNHYRHKQHELRSFLPLFVDDDITQFTVAWIDFVTLNLI